MTDLMDLKATWLSTLSALSHFEVPSLDDSSAVQLFVRDMAKELDAVWDRIRKHYNISTSSMDYESLTIDFINPEIAAATEIPDEEEPDIEDDDDTLEDVDS